MPCAPTYDQAIKHAYDDLISLIVESTVPCRDEDTVFASECVENPQHLNLRGYYLHVFINRINVILN